MAKQANELNNAQTQYTFVQPYTTTVNKPKTSRRSTAKSEQASPSPPRDVSSAKLSDGSITSCDEPESWNTSTTGSTSDGQITNDDLFCLDSILDFPDMHMVGDFATLPPPFDLDIWSQDTKPLAFTNGTQRRLSINAKGKAFGAMDISTDLFETCVPQSNNNSHHHHHNNNNNMPRKPSVGGQNCFSGYTSLHVAAHRGFLSIVQMLIENGVEIDQLSDGFQTSLHLAAGEGHTEVVQYLLAHGADPLRVDAYGRTVLHAAAASNRCDVVRLLLDSIVDPNVADRYGQTALHTAVATGNAEVVRLMLDRGVDGHAKISPNSLR